MPDISLEIPCKMDAFWWHLKEKLSKKTLFKQGQHQCNEWVGCLEHGTYVKLTVTWPDGTKSVERCHRVSYMAAHDILRAEMPCINDNGKKLEVSHLCHNGICVKKKVREKSRECHNHKLQPFPDPKRKRKPTNLNKH